MLDQKMKLERVSNATTVLAFITGEIDSPQFGNLWASWVRALHVPTSILSAPDLDDADENNLRAKLLHSVRGPLFAGLPTDTTWYQTTLSSEEIGDLRYGMFDAWLRLSVPTRLVKTGADRLEAADDFPADAKSRINHLASRMREGVPVGALIVLGTTIDGPFVLMEGYHRATAYAGISDAHLPASAFVGVARNMTEWCAFGPP